MADTSTYIQESDFQSYDPRELEEYGLEIFHEPPPGTEYYEPIPSDDRDLDEVLEFLELKEGVLNGIETFSDEVSRDFKIYAFLLLAYNIFAADIRKDKIVQDLLLPAIRRLMLDPIVLIFSLSSPILTITNSLVRMGLKIPDPQMLDYYIEEILGVELGDNFKHLFPEKDRDKYIWYKRWGTFSFETLDLLANYIGVEFPYGGYRKVERLYQDVIEFLITNRLRDPLDPIKMNFLHIINMNLPS